MLPATGAFRGRSRVSDFLVRRHADGMQACLSADVFGLGLGIIALRLLAILDGNG